MLSAISSDVSAPKSRPIGATVRESSAPEAANVSALTGIALPSGARLIREMEVVTDSARKLQRRAAQLSPNLTLRNVEILMWPRSSLSPRENGAEVAIIQVQTNLAKAGYLWQQTAHQTQKQAAIREFVAVSRSGKRIVPGFWMTTDTYLLLAWGSFAPRSGEE